MKKLAAYGYFVFFSIFSVSLSSNAFAQQVSNIDYLDLGPDIVTNYLGTDARKLGYVRITIDLVISDASKLEIAEHHLPLLRAIAVEVIGQQSQEKVKSAVGKEEIRKAILEEMQKQIKQETGAELIQEVIFTKFITPI